MLAKFAKSLLPCRSQQKDLLNPDYSVNQQMHVLLFDILSTYFIAKRHFYLRNMRVQYGQAKSKWCRWSVKSPSFGKEADVRDRELELELVRQEVFERAAFFTSRQRSILVFSPRGDWIECRFDSWTAPLSAIAGRVRNREWKTFSNDWFALRSAVCEVVYTCARDLEIDNLYEFDWIW